MSTHFGEFEELEQAVTASGVSGIWKPVGQGGMRQFRGRAGEVLNWYPSTGTMQFQGRNRETFEPRVLELLGASHALGVTSINTQVKIFLVHGHDHAALDELELVLRRLGLQPLILQNSSSGGLTIIEALEQKIYEETSFGIVLLTPDDYGFAKRDGEAARRPRARQNAILEMGMVMAALGRERVVILRKGALEVPSDASGIIYLEFNEHVREVATQLAMRLQEAGFELTSEQIAGAGR
ncbi:MAG: TIR domain-containing protein [Thermomicrobiales bacterium]